jgi:uncharacterized protein (DUF2336 family)
MGVVALCERDGPKAVREDAARLLIDQVFMTLVVEAEREVRRKLAERIAEADWAPKALVDILALDEIEIARPVIAASPLLTDADLIRLIVQATLEHRIEVARRPALGQAVVEAIVDRNEPAALAALARNQTANIGPEAMNRLVESARRLPALRAPLSRHPKLTEALGVRLYAWVGEALRASLAERFHLDERALAAAIDHAVQAVQTEPGGQFIAPAPSPEQEAMDQILVRKLDAAGQLKTGYLLRSLRENKLSLFEAALAQLSGLETAELRRALTSDQPELLAMACMAAGVDRGVFSSLIAKVRELNSGLPGGGEDGLKRALKIFSVFPPDLAVGNFRRVLAQLRPEA